MSQFRFGTKLVHRLSTRSLDEVRAFLEDYDYVRGATHPRRWTDATRIIRGVEAEKRRRMGARGV